MNNFDQDDILLEIKRRKRAGGTSAQRPAVEHPSSETGSEVSGKTPSAPEIQETVPGQQPMMERVNRSSAGIPQSQDEQWDQLWQSVATKQKKPVLFDYDAVEKQEIKHRASTEQVAHRASHAAPDEVARQPASAPAPASVPAAPATVAVEEPVSFRRTASEKNFELHIPDLEFPQQQAKQEKQEDEAKPSAKPRQDLSFERDDLEQTLGAAIDDQQERELTNHRRSKIDDFFANKNFGLDEGSEEEPDAPVEQSQPPLRQQTEPSQPEDKPPFPSRRLNARRLTQEEELPEESEESESAMTAEQMRDEIRHTRTGILVRMGVSLLCFALLFYFHMAKVHMLIMPEFLYPEYHPLTFIAVNLAILLTTVLVNSSIVGGGLLSLFTFKPDTDSLTSLSAVASVVQGAVLTAMPKHVMDPSVHLYLFIPALALFFSNVGRLMYINRVDRGSRIVFGEYDKYAICKLEDGALARELTRGLDIDDPSVAFSVKAQYLTGYEDAAYSHDFSENLSRILAPICLVASLAVALAGYFLSEDRNPFAALTAFAALSAICSPLTASIAASMPLGRMSKKLHKEGAMIAGYEAADDLSDVSAVVLSATDLFTSKDITLFSVKPFAEKRIDEALLDAASLICASESTLSGIFSNIIQGQKKLLRPVENIVYEDGMGISAWVNKKRVLIGNRTLMQHHGIDTPSKDFEAKFCRDHRDILYLANSGELSAMFVLGYSANEQVQWMLDDLASQKITIVVSTNDPNVTAEKISRLYDFPMEDIRIVPSQIRDELMAYQQPRETAPASAAHMGNAASLVSTVCASYSTRTAVVLATMIQFLGIILGYGVLAFFIFTGSVAHLTPDLIGIYMMIWAVLVMVVPRLRRL